MSFEDDEYEKYRQTLIDDEREARLELIASEDFKSTFEELDEIDKIIVWEIYQRIYAPKRLSERSRSVA